MRCIKLIKRNSNSELKYDNIPLPKASDDAVIVKTLFCSLNGFDKSNIRSHYRDSEFHNADLIPGGDFAGQVIFRGKFVKEFSIGDYVFGSSARFNESMGALSELIKVSPNSISKAPYNITCGQSASIVTPASISIDIVKTYLKIHYGQKILIHNAYDPIGIFSLQLCKNIGAETAVTVSHENIDYMKHLEADLIINKDIQPFEKIISCYDAVIDLAGGDILRRSYNVVCKRGKIISVIEKPDNAILSIQDKKGYFIRPHITTQSLNSVRFLIEENIIKPFPVEVIKFEDAIREIDKFLKEEQNKVYVITFIKQ